MEPVPEWASQVPDEPPRGVKHATLIIDALWSGDSRQAAIGFLCSLVKEDGSRERLTWTDQFRIVEAHSEQLAHYKASFYALTAFLDRNPQYRYLRLNVHTRLGELDRILTKRGSTNVAKDVQEWRLQLAAVREQHKGFVWCKSWYPARQEREPESYKMTFVALQRRLRQELGSRRAGDGAPKYWVNMAEVALIIGEIEETMGKKPSLLEATVYHLRVQRLKKFKDIAENLRLSTKQVHNAYNRINRALHAASPRTC